MALQADLKAAVGAIFGEDWSDRAGSVVPHDGSLKLGNDAVTLNATVLYADLADSTRMVDGYTAQFAAEVYKAVLHCAGKIILSEGGVITAYDGDRVMAVFIGTTKNTNAVRAGLKISWAIRNIVAPALRAQYRSDTYVPKMVVGIDTSDLFVAKTGVRGSNDLVWVGRAANHAAKLAALPESHPVWITKEVFDVMMPQVKVNNGVSMWEARVWTAMQNRKIYRSNWGWPVA